MAKLHDRWEVLPHGPVREVAPGILTIVGQIPMPLGNFPRRMTVVAIDRNRSAIFSPMPLRENSMMAIEALGAPAYLIAPSGGHRLDLRPFHARYPKAKIVTAPRSKPRVEEAVRPAQTRAALGRHARLEPLAGCKGRELVLRIERDSEVTLVTNDVIGNVAHPQGLGASLMSRLLGFGPQARVTRPAKWFLIEDKAALAAQFREWADIEGLKRLIPSHGDIVDRPSALLERLARSLD
jgi:hypothetical protein